MTQPRLHIIERTNPTRYSAYTYNGTEDSYSWLYTSSDLGDAVRFFGKHYGETSYTVRIVLGAEAARLFARKILTDLA